MKNVKTFLYVVPAALKIGVPKENWRKAYRVTETQCSTILNEKVILSET